MGVPDSTCLNFNLVSYRLLIAGRAWVDRALWRAPHSRAVLQRHRKYERLLAWGCGIKAAESTWTWRLAGKKPNQCEISKQADCVLTLLYLAEDFTHCKRNRASGLVVLTRLTSLRMSLLPQAPCRWARSSKQRFRRLALYWLFQPQGIRGCSTIEHESISDRQC